MYLIGNKREPVRQVQTALHRLGYGESHLVPIDGIYGENTRVAVMNYQQRRNLPVSGSVNYETFLMLLYEYELLNLSDADSTVFPLKMGDQGEQIRLLHAYLNIIYSENKNGHIPFVSDIFEERTQEYVNLFLRRIGERENGEITGTQFGRLERESRISLENDL